MERPSKLQVKRATTTAPLPSPVSPKISDSPKSDSSKSDATKSDSIKSDDEKINSNAENGNENDNQKPDETNQLAHIPDVYKTQGTMSYSSCTGYSESTCLCSSIDDGSHTTSKRVSYLERRNWITTERLSELRKKAQDAMKNHKIFTIRGCFYSIRKSLVQKKLLLFLPKEITFWTVLSDVLLFFFRYKEDG